MKKYLRFTPKLDQNFLTVNLDLIGLDETGVYAYLPNIPENYLKVILSGDINRYPIIYYTYNPQVGVDGFSLLRCEEGVKLLRKLHGRDQRYSELTGVNTEPYWSNAVKHVIKVVGASGLAVNSPINFLDKYAIYSEDSVVSFMNDFLSGLTQGESDEKS